MADFPVSVHRFPARKDADPAGYQVLEERIVVPGEFPFTAWLAHAPKTGVGIHATVDEEGGATFQKVGVGMPLGPGQFTCTPKGKLQFYPGDGETELLVSYTGVGTADRAGHLQEVQDELEATQETLLALLEDTAPVLAAPARTVNSGIILGVQAGQTPAGQEHEFTVPGVTSESNYRVVAVKVTKATATGTSAATVVRVSTVAAGAGGGSHVDITIAAGASRSAGLTAAMTVVSGTSLYVFVQSATGGHSDIQFNFELEAAP